MKKAKTLDDARDFIGNARNTLASQRLNLLTVKEIVEQNNVGGLANEVLSSDDPDFPSPMPRSLQQRVDELEESNAVMFDLVGQLQDFFDVYPDSLKEAIKAVSKMNGSDTALDTELIFKEFNVIYKNKSYSTRINVTGGLKIGTKQLNNPRVLLKISQPTI